MKTSKLQSLRPWFSLACATVVLAACGGGGGEPGTNPPPSSGDARSGDYTLLAADGREYALSLDFDAATYRVTGNGVTQDGTLAEQGSEFLLQPGNSVGTNGTSTTRLTVADNAVVGELVLADRAVPFIAPRVFETTVAGAVGRYNMLGRTVTADGSASDTTIQQGEITATGQLRTCDDNLIFEIAACPASSVSSGNITVAGNVFTALTPAGNVVFRVARIAGDRVFVRASPTAVNTRRFVVGTPATTGFAPGTFVGGTTEPAWGTVSIASTITPGSFGFSMAGVQPNGATSARNGTAVAVGAAGADTRASLLRANAGAAGDFFVARSAQVGVVVALRGSTTAGGFLALGTTR